MSIEVAVPEDATKEFEILVNSRPYTVPSKTVTYDQVAMIAFPDWREGDQFKITYRRAGHGEWKLMAVGSSVDLKDGEEFVVERTHRS